MKMSRDFFATCRFCHLVCHFCHSCVMLGQFCFFKVAKNVFFLRGIVTFCGSLSLSIFPYTHTCTHTGIHTYLRTYVHTYIHTYTKKTSDRNDRKIDKQNDRPKLKSQKQIIKRELQKKCKKYIYIYINHLQCMAVSFFLTVAARGGHMPPWRHNNAAIKHAVTRMRPQDSYKIASSGN